MRALILAVRTAGGGLALAAMLGGCCDLDLGCYGDVSQGHPNALYRKHGSAWNDYVRNDGSSQLSASGDACDPAADGPRYFACLNGGEHRVIKVRDVDNCTDLTASDALGAFDWVCLDDKKTVRFASTGLKDERGLSDLIDFGNGEWLKNSLTVRNADGARVYTSPAKKWWPNPIRSANEGGVLDRRKSIYLISQDAGESYAVTEEKIAVLVKAGVTVTGNGSDPALATASGADFAWVEGTFDGNGATGLEVGGRFSMLRYVHATNGNYGIVLSGSKNLMRGSTASENVSPQLFGDVGIEISGMHNVVINSVSAQNEYGFDISGNDQLLQAASSSNNEFWGVRVEGTRQILDRVTATHNGEDGFKIIGLGDHLLLNLTATGNVDDGVSVNGSSGTSHNVLVNVLAANNGFGLFLDRSEGNRLVDVVVAHNDIGIQISDSDADVFTGQLKVGGNTTNCDATGGTAGLVDGTCANAGDSDATLTTGVNMAGSLVGRVTTNDTENPDDVDGASSFSAISDWTGFESVQRTWAAEDTGFPNTRSGCGSTDTCRIWDWRLATGDTGDGGGAVALGELTLPVGDDAIQHLFGDGNDATFLRHAVEVFGDGVGDDDGLCESGETCLYTPNIGSYQGHTDDPEGICVAVRGDFCEAGTTSSGSTLSNITLLEYDANGI